MIKHLYASLLIGVSFFFSLNLNAQSFQVSKNPDIKTNNITVSWNDLEQKSNGEYFFSFESPTPFSCFAFGVKTDLEISANIMPEYRLFINDKWTKWIKGEFEHTPEVNQTNMLWSGLLFTLRQELRSKIEFRITGQENILEVKMAAYDVISDPINQASKPNLNTNRSINICPDVPTVIGREVWLHPYYGTQSYTPTTISPHHVVIHHGASPDTYSDGASVVRSYWNYHVNTLGWSDVGYNYLTDKYGNIYQGRKNSDIINGDVRGAHAGAANSESIGINFLGNSDVTLPTAVQLQSCYNLLAWWFNSRGYAPNESADMTTQNSGILSIPRISGHQDVNIGGTSCPGDALYAYLDEMRIQTQAIINACGGYVETEASSSNEWKTQDFTCSFEDTATSGIKERFYQVIDFDGNDWSANSNYGFFADNFTSFSNNWQTVDGTWSATNNYLLQTDEASTNTILSTELNQNDANSYLYNFTAMITGSGTNKRAGLHFMCSSPDSTNRGNSYLVYYRTDFARVEIYKVDDDVLQIEVMEDYTMQDDIYYDFKIVFLKSTGEIIVYIDNEKIASWIDPSPHQTGNYISMRTGNCALQTSELKIYHSRGSSENVSIGDDTKEIRFQNPSPAVHSAKIKSVILDNNDLLSSVYHHNLNIDWTKPSSVSVFDGLQSDIDTFNTETSISSNWDTAFENHSGLDKYWYSVGTSIGNNDIVDWTSTINNSFTINSLSLTQGQTYYTNVQSVNNAGLWSTISSSNGQVLDIFHSIEDKQQSINIYPNPTRGIVNIDLSSHTNQMVDLNIYNAVGQTVLSDRFRATTNKFIKDLRALNQGIYFISIIVNDQKLSSKIEIIR